MNRCTTHYLLSVVIEEKKKKKKASPCAGHRDVTGKLQKTDKESKKTKDVVLEAIIVFCTQLARRGHALTTSSRNARWRSQRK